MKDFAIFVVVLAVVLVGAITLTGGEGMPANDRVITRSQKVIP